MSKTPFGTHSNRRDFLKIGATLAVGSVVATTLSACKQDDEEVEWNEETDVIVVGAGGAGLTAAIEALRDGAAVLLLEKAEEHGGNTALSGGVIQAAGTAPQVEAGVTDDTPDDHYDYYEQAGEGIPTPELLRVLTDSAPDAITFMEGLGLPYNAVYGVGPIPTVDPELMVDRIHVPGDEVVVGAGAGHVAVLHAEVDSLGGEIRTEARVHELIVDPVDGVVGVRVEMAGVMRNIRALRGVVLASGGFDWSLELARAYSPQQLWELETGLCLCSPTNTGDGMVMGMEVGADLAGLGGTIGVPGVAIGAGALAPGLPEFAGIWVNKYGRRFMNEEAHYAYAMRGVFDQEDHLAWAIFDDTVAQLGGSVISGIWGTWSEDLSEEIASGLVIRADTLAALGTALGANPGELAGSVAKWNADMVGGVDTVYGKVSALEPIETGPFYAVQVTSVNLGTCGGLKINANTQVMSLYGDPIPRLYAAGMVTGGFIGPYYPGSGTAILGTVVFGRLAGMGASAETALEPAKNLV
jgi:fumarate reductase flavoprotein subunit